MVKEATVEDHSGLRTVSTLVAMAGTITAATARTVAMDTLRPMGARLVVDLMALLVMIKEVSYVHVYSGFALLQNVQAVCRNSVM